MPDKFVMPDKKPQQPPVDVTPPDPNSHAPTATDRSPTATVPNRHRRHLRTARAALRLRPAKPARLDAMKITKLPPGEAVGARDLQTWSSRRAAGRAGVPLTKKERRERDWARRDRGQRWLDRAEGRRRP